MPRYNNGEARKQFENRKPPHRAPRISQLQETPAPGGSLGFLGPKSKPLPTKSDLHTILSAVSDRQQIRREIMISSSHFRRGTAQSLTCGFFLLLSLLASAGCDEVNSSGNASPNPKENNAPPTPEEAASGGRRVDPDSAFGKQMRAYILEEVDQFKSRSDSDIDMFDEGTIGVDFKVGFKTLDGKIITPARFDSAFDFTEGVAAVKLGKKWGYIDRKGAFAIQPRFDEAFQFGDGRAAVSSTVQRTSARRPQCWRGRIDTR